MNKEWLTEPNDKEFESNGLKCIIHRHPSLKHLCGYIAVPLGHKLYGVDYSKLYDWMDIQVHGGLTYAGKKGDDWLFGFDCAHWHDLIPSSIENGYHEPGDIYRNMAYVESELHCLAEQLQKEESHE